MTTPVHRMYAHTMPDPVLDHLNELAHNARRAALELYDAIRDAKTKDYGYVEIENATHLQRGTVQNILNGRNPRLTVIPDIDI